MSKFWKKSVEKSVFFFQIFVLLSQHDANYYLFWAQFQTLYVKLFFQSDHKQQFNIHIYEIFVSLFAFFSKETTHKSSLETFDFSSENFKQRKRVLGFWITCLQKETINQLAVQIETMVRNIYK